MLSERTNIKKGRWIRFLWLGISAILTGLTLCFPALWPLEWVSMIPVLGLLLTLASDRELRLRRLYGYGVFYFFCFGLAVFHWFVNLYPLSFIDGMTKPAAFAVVCAGWFGLSLLQATMGGLVFVTAGLLFRSRVVTSCPYLKPFFAGALWAIYEWTQTLGFWGVPWGRLALGQTGFLVGVQTASLFGSYFVTFVLVTVNGFLAYALLHRKEGRAWRLSVLLVAGLWVFQYGVGAALYFLGEKPSYPSVTVAAVQGNVDSGEKWDMKHRFKTFRVYRDYTLKAAEAGAEIVVWPESALPYTLQKGYGTYEFVSELAREANVTILAGGFVYEKGGEGEFNAMVCFLPDGSSYETTYAKRHLVPFGEYVPMEPLFSVLIPPLTELEMSGMDLTAGKDSAVFFLEEGALGSLICFDSIYEELTRDSVLDGAEVLCLSTNDSWFTDSVALNMHNAQAQLRAVESHRYVLRSANTGLTTILSSRGEILSEIEPLTDGMLVGEVVPLKGITLYMRIGNLFVYLCISAILACLGEDAWRRKYKKG